MANQEKAYKLIQISVEELAKGIEGEFSTSYPLLIPALTQSIREFGLIQPLLVCFKNGAYQVLCGHRRLAACHELGYSSVACLLISEQPPLQLFKLAIYDNLSTRQLNPLEKAAIICKLLNYVPREKVICDYLPVLGLQPHYKILDKYLDIAKLEEKLKQAILCGRLHEEAAIQLIKWPASDQLTLADMFISIPLSVSSQQEVISNAWEISQREDVFPAEVLSAEEIVELLGDNSLSGPQKGCNLRRYLAKRRYPKYSLAQSNFKRHVNRLQLPQGTKLVPPANFETSKFRLECNFAALAQLNAQLSALSNTMQNESWQAILRLGVEDDP